MEKNTDAKRKEHVPLREVSTLIYLQCTLYWRGLAEGSRTVRKMKGFFSKIVVVREDALCPITKIEAYVVVFSNHLYLQSRRVHVQSFHISFFVEEKNERKMILSFYAMLMCPGMCDCENWNDNRKSHSESQGPTQF